MPVPRLTSAPVPDEKPYVPLVSVRSLAMSNVAVPGETFAPNAMAEPFVTVALSPFANATADVPSVQFAVVVSHVVEAAPVQVTSLVHAVHAAMESIAKMIRFISAFLSVRLSFRKPE